MRKRDYQDNSASNSANFSKKNDHSLRKVKETEAMMKQSTDYMNRRVPEEPHQEDPEEVPMTFENQLKAAKNDGGLDAARKIFNQQQKIMRN